MAQITRSLWVAITAAVLLIALVSVDASINTTVTLQVHGTSPGQDAPEWHTLATSEDEPYFRPGGEVRIEANRSDELSFRLLVDHEAPWGYEESFTAHSNGMLVADGTLTAAGSSEDEALFTVPANELLDQGPRASPDQDRHIVNMDVQIGADDRTLSETSLYATFAIEEVQQ